MNPADPYGLVGQVLDGQFRVDKLVGEGGFSTVYRGHNVGLNEPVALKCLKLPAAIGTALVDTFIQRFRDESRILYRLSQGNLHIVRSLGAGTTQSPVTGALIPYMALEWLEGRSLAADFQVRRTTNKTGRPLDEILRLFENAADALGFAHAQGIVHRDLNPGNLFLVSGPKGVTMKVLDFGVAKIMDDSLGLGPRQQTMGQFRIFAPAYGAPEQFDDRIGKVSAASDVYAFALILIEALRDHAVNEGQHLGDFARLATDPARRPTPRFFGVELPDEVEKAFAKATTLDPNERWQSAAEMWKAITSANSFATEARYEAAARETPPLAGPGPKKQGTLPMTNKDLGRTMPLGTSGWAPPPKPGAAKPEFKPKLGNATTEPLPDKSPAAPAPPPRASYAKTEPQKVFTTGDNAATDDEVGESTVVAPVPKSVKEQAVPPPNELKAPPPKAAPQRTVALGDPSALKARDEALARARAAVGKPLPAAGRPASVPKMPATGARPSTLAFGASAPEPHTSATKTNPAPAPVADESDVQEDPDAMFGDDGDPTRAQAAPVAKPVDDVEEPPPSGRTLVMAPAPVRPPGSMMPNPAPPDVPPPPQRMLAGTQMLGAPPPMQAPQPFGPQSPYGGGSNQPPPQQQQAPMSPFARSALQPQGQPQQGGPWPPQQGGQSQLMPMQGGQSQMMPPHGQQPPHMMQGQQGGQSQMMPPHNQQGGQQAAQPFMPSPYAPRPSMDGGPPSTAQPGFEQPKKNPYLVIGIAFGAVAILGIGLSLVFIGRKPSGPQLASASASASAEPVPVAIATATATASATPSATAATAVDAAIEEPADAAVASADAGTEGGAAATTDAATPATTAAATGVATNTTPPPNTAVAVPFTPPPAASSAKPVDPNAWNEGVARGKLNSANAVLVICKKDGAVSGPGSATVTFGVDGAVTSVSVDPPYAGTKEGECAMGQFRRVKVNAFNGSPQTLRHSFEVPK